MQAHYCAQINEDGVVVALSQVHSPIGSPNLITAPDLDASLLGKVYNPVTGGFESPPPPPPAPALRHLTKLAFRNRFSKAEKAGIEFAALDDPSAPMAQRQQAAALRSYLKDQGLERASDAGTEVTGILVPHAQLLLQKFEFNRESLKSGEAGVGVNLLELIGLKIGAKAKQVDALDFKLPTNAVFAFRAEPLLFAQDCAQSK